MPLVLILIKINSSSITKVLESQDDLPQWAVASEDVIYKIATGSPLFYGRRSRLLNRLFNIVGVSCFGKQALRFVAMCVAFTWWLKTKRQSRCIHLTSIELFMGYGSRSELGILESLNNRKKVATTVVHLDQTNPASVGRVACPGICKMLAFAWREGSILEKALRNSRCEYIRNYTTDWITSAARHLGMYVFYRAWFEALPVEINHVTFINSDTALYGCLDSSNAYKDIHIEFYQHGLLNKYLIVPKVKKATILTRPEAIYYKNRNPECDVRVIGPNKSLIPSHQNVLLHTLNPGCYSDEDLDFYNQVYSFARRNGHSVVARPCPTIPIDCMYEKFFSGVQSFMIDKSISTISKCLRDWKPRFVMAWHTTSLIYALKFGILPILLRREHGMKIYVGDGLFSLNEVALNWPHDRELIERLCMDSQLYDMELKKRIKMVL